MGEIRKQIGENIKRVCSLKGIRQVEIAEHMGVSQGSVSNWIKGINSIDIENLAELCSFLGVSLDQIYGVAPLTPEAVLSNDDRTLLDAFHQLNEEGREKLLDYADDLVQSEKYIKKTGSGKMDREA